MASIFNDPKSYADWKTDIQEYQYKRTNCAYKTKPVMYHTHKQEKKKSRAYNPVIQEYTNRKKVINNFLLITQ